MDASDSNVLTPEDLENGLVDGTLNRESLEKLISSNVHENENIDTLLNFFLNYLPGKRSISVFLNKAREYNSARICGLVWNANVIAYRCKTCSISPCMSICAQCFHNSNHEGHNYNMFKSQAGGACDCGDSSVMHDFGFCRFHGENRPEAPSIPREIVCCAELMIPHLLRVFVRALRIDNISGDFITEQKLLEILNQLSSAGSAVQIYLTRTLTDAELYREFTTDSAMIRLYHHEYCTNEHLALSPNFFVESLATDTDANGLIPFDVQLRTMLDEIMMWCVSARLPEELVRFLLSLLPDLDFKLSFTETFLRFYGIIAQSLIDESHSEASDIPPRLVHISVQLFSSQMIAEYAMEHYHLIEVILSSIWRMFVSTIDQDRSDDIDDDDDEHILKIHPLALIDDSTSGMVINMDHPIVIKNVYWPLTSDFVNILAQEKIAVSIMENKKYFHFWLRFLTLFQGMNVSERLIGHHVEYESQAYVYAFTIELEISAAAMWCFLSHLKPNYSVEKLTLTIQSIVNSIHEWMQSLHFNENRMDPWKLTFHLPLHRYLSIFSYHAIYKYNIDPVTFLPVNDENLLYNLIYFPLRTLSGYFEVLSNIWLRNGQQLLIQAKTYGKSAFSSSMHDADIFLIQLISSFIEPNRFINLLLNKFHIYPWLFDCERRGTLEMGHQLSMLESALIFICAIVGFRPNITIRDPTQTRAEIVSILAVSDRLYSEVEENVPDPSPLSANRKDVETILEQVSDFQTPSVELMGNLQQGKYSIRNSVFRNEFDPLHVIMRSSKRAHFQNSLERFTNLIKHEGSFKSDFPLWPPFRIPQYENVQTSKVQRILRSAVLHEFLFRCLKAFLKEKSFTENILYFTVFLLELSILSAEESRPISIEEKSNSFTSDNIFVNLLTPISTGDDEQETMITLLLKILQKQRPNDFFVLIEQIFNETNSNSTSSTRIGDNFSFISNLLELAGKRQTECRRNIEQQLRQIKLEHQQQQQTQTIGSKVSDLSAEQKRQRAKNRQQKLLAEIAQSQKRFISQQNPNDNLMLIGTPPSLTNENEYLDVNTGEKSNNPLDDEQFIDYECCVCRTSKSDSESPIGLIGTSCLSLLPSLKSAVLNEFQKRIFRIDSETLTLDKFLNVTKNALIEITGHPSIADFCQNDHHLRSLLIQSCGHSIHVDCLSSYLKALHPNQERAEPTNNPILPSNTNFRCPLCRQSANTLIPLFDSKDYFSKQEIPTIITGFERLHQSMIRPSRPEFKRSGDSQCLLAFLTGLAAKCVSEEKTPASNLNALTNHLSMKQRAAEFDCGTLRAQLVHEQLFFESANRSDQKTIRKSCYKILHDLHHLGYPFHHQRLWEEISGVSCPATVPDVFDPNQNLAPVLLRDSTTILLQLLMSGPINLSSDQFDILVQLIFNVEFFKNLFATFIEHNINVQDLSALNVELNDFLKIIHECNLIENSNQRRPMNESLQELLMKNFYDFFKLSALVKCRLYSKEIPWTTGGESSPWALAEFLNLNMTLNGLALPRWFCENPTILIQKWIEQFRIAAQQKPLAMKVLICERPIFTAPSFVNLPFKYDDIFHQYNEFRCEFCERISTDNLLCLICGNLHVKRGHQICCTEQRQRCIKHLTKCAHPAAIMLDIQTTLIVVCQSDVYGYWHSLYLDQHGEEDPKLKRGKTLYLNQKRAAVLRTLWLTATYDYQIQHWLSYNSVFINQFEGF